MGLTVLIADDETMPRTVLRDHLPWEELGVTRIVEASDGDETVEQARAYREKQIEALSAVIAEKTETYIWDKAYQLGLDVTASVTVAAGESGIPLPESVTLAGPYSPALAAAIEEGVGVPVERQYWLEESEWTRKESERG